MRAVKFFVDTHLDCSEYMYTSTFQTYNDVMSFLENLNYFSNQFDGGMLFRVSITKVIEEVADDA